MLSSRRTVHSLFALVPVLLLQCMAGIEATAGSIRLAWGPNRDPSVTGYHVYRSAVSGTGYVRLTANPTAVPYYVDTTVASPGTFYYVTTSLDANGRESAFSREVKAVLGSYDPSPETATLTVRAVPDSSARSGQMVVLSGWAWNPEDRTLSFLWSQIDGPPVTIVNATNPDACFVAPVALTNEAGLAFRLTVTESGQTVVTDTVRITVRNK